MTESESHRHEFRMICWPCIKAILDKFDARLKDLEQVTGGPR